MCIRDRAHRFSSIRVATRILVFEGGRIVGDGSHAELYASCPLYRELYDASMGMYHFFVVHLELLKVVSHLRNV